MRVSIAVGSAYSDGENWQQLVELVRCADSMGIDTAWSAEAWGMDAVSSLAYLAACTERIRLGTGIMQLTARTPSMTAMSSLSLAKLSGDRFTLGLGASGPQVVEGLHGEAFSRPLERMREYVEIVRLGTGGQRLQYQGKRYQLPRPGGQGKALKLAMQARPALPIYLATLGEKSLELTGEIADGWLGSCIVPERCEVLVEPLRRGAEKVGRSLDDIDLHVNTGYLPAENVEASIENAKAGMAFLLGGMGSAKTNFYNAAYARQGYAEAAAQVQRLWVAGDKAAAVAAVPEEMVLATMLMGDDAMIRDRIRALKAAGINAITVEPKGASSAEMIAGLERLKDLVDRENACQVSSPGQPPG